MPPTAATSDYGRRPQAHPNPCAIGAHIYTITRCQRRAASPKFRADHDSHERASYRSVRAADDHSQDRIAPAPSPIGESALRSAGSPYVAPRGGRSSTHSSVRASHRVHTTLARLRYRTRYPAQLPRRSIIQIWMSIRMRGCGATEVGSAPVSCTNTSIRIWCAKNTHSRWRRAGALRSFEALFSSTPDTHCPPVFRVVPPRPGTT